MPKEHIHKNKIIFKTNHLKADAQKHDTVYPVPKQ